MKDTASVVELKQVHKHYKGVDALKGVSLSIKPGEILGLFGHNGAGKTTTIKLILGLTTANSGSICVFGKDPALTGTRELRTQIGFLQENVAFYDQLTGLEVLQYFGRLKQVSKKACQVLLEQVGLRHAEHRRVKTYSKGMRQRLGLAQALLGDPKLLLLDEPTVGLDPIATQDFYQRLQLLKARGCTVILCSHVLPGVEKYIDRALILGGGSVLAEGNLQDLRHKADLPMTITLDGDVRLPEQLANLRSGDAESIELSLPISRKMEVLEAVMGLKGLRNLDLHLPTLEDIYTHFTSTLLNKSEQP
ncbi:MAG: ABC transporter ATP-binding protein [Pseudomonadales bacterium]